MPCRDNTFPQAVFFALSTSCTCFESRKGSSSVRQLKFSMKNGLAAAWLSSKFKALKFWYDWKHSVEDGKQVFQGWSWSSDSGPEDDRYGKNCAKTKLRRSQLMCFEQFRIAGMQKLCWIVSESLHKRSNSKKWPIGMLVVVSDMLPEMIYSWKSATVVVNGFNRLVQSNHNAFFSRWLRKLNSISSNNELP